MILPHAVICNGDGEKKSTQKCPFDPLHVYLKYKIEQYKYLTKLKFVLYRVLFSLNFAGSIIYIFKRV